MKPVIALVGRPNVGKSTLFNRLTRRRDAIVVDVPGVTRDRHYGDGLLGGRSYIVIDTGGLEPDTPKDIYVDMARQTEQAIVEADVVILITDARAGLTPGDRVIAERLRRLKDRVWIAVNKAEGMDPQTAVATSVYLRPPRSKARRRSPRGARGRVRGIRPPRSADPCLRPC